MNLARVAQLIRQTELPASEQAALVVLFSRITDAALGPLIDQCKKDPGLLQSISRTYQDKLRAVESNDIKSWNNIIDQEQNMLTNINNLP